MGPNAHRRNIVVALLLLTHAVYGQILRYLATTVSGSATLPYDHWATYDQEAHLGQRSASSDVDDTASLDPVGFSTPYFEVASVSWYIDSNGFLSTVPYSLCDHYCVVNPSIVTGNYSFSLAPNGSLLGGNWPMIGLYVADLNPSANGTQSAIYKRIRNKYSDNITTALVEFRNVRAYGGAVTDTLTGQVELWPNGTIIMRYASVLRSFGAIVPSVGLILSPRQYSVVATPLMKDGQTVDVAAIRFDPIVDPCAQATSCASCLGTFNCTWCSTSATCIASDVVNEYCPSSQMQNDTCVAPVNDPATGQQLFYNVRTENFAPPTGVDSSTRVELQVASTSTNDAFYKVPLGFNMTYFDFPATLVPGLSPATTDTLYLQANGAVKFLSPASCVSCSLPGISPFVALTMTLSNASAFRVAKRLQGGDFCPKALVDSTGYCAESIVLQLAMSATALPALSLNATVIVTQAGYTTVVVSSTRWWSGATWNRFSASLLPVIPASTTGMVDPNGRTSPTMPWLRVTPATAITFVPNPGCYSCRSGLCVVATMTCACAAAFRGVACTECNTGYYGPSCASCPTCLNGGSCDDGVRGTGRCLCTDPWSGPTCSIKCAATDPRPLNNCSSCNANGGACTCGQCVCATAKGWSGKSCSVWNDPCLPYSFDGCSTCVTNPNVQCTYCQLPDFRCLAATGQAGMTGAPFSQCQTGTTVITANTKASCFRFRYSDSGSSGPNILIVLAAFVGIGLLVCTGVFGMWFCRSLPVNPLIYGVVPSRVEPKRVRREREVVQVQVYTVSERLMHGIPIKQVPLRELYEEQQRARSM